MRTLRVFLRRVYELFAARAVDNDLRTEIQSHLEEATEDYIRQGRSPEEARREALRSFGGVAHTEQAHRDARAFLPLDHLRTDLRHAARSLRRNPGFSVVALLVLTVATGAITAVFALLNAVVLRPLPYPDPDRLVVIRHSVPGLSRDDAGMSSGLYFHYASQAQSIESIGLYEDRVLNLRLPDSGTERVHVTLASAALFRVLGARPALGRLFTDEDGRPGFMNTRWKIPVLLAHSFWVSRFGSDPNVVGRTVTINESPREIVGVLPDGFAFPNPETQIWILSEPPRSTTNMARSFNYSAVARMRPGVTVASARDELTRILPQVAGTSPDATPERLADLGLAPIVAPLKTAVLGDIAQIIWPLFGGMAFLLLIAAANTAGLFLIRADHRRREIAVRHALGAHGHHVARLFFIEALLLSGTAAALGLALARVLLSIAISLAPVTLPRSEEIALDVTAVFFAAGVALLTAGCYAILAVRRQGRSLTLNIGSGQWSTGRRQSLRRPDPLIALQVALALALMVGSALMVKTYRNLSLSALGFAPERVLTVEVGVPSRQAGQHARIYRDLVDRLGRLPGVDHASAASFVPLTESQHIFPVEAGAPPVLFKFFTPGLFQTLRIPIVEGPSFAGGDQVTVPYPVLISATLARRLYPAESAIGKSIRRLNEDGSVVDLRGPVPPFTIVAIVGDVRETSLRDGPAEIVYIPVVEPSVEQSIVPISMSLVIRTHVPPLTLATSVREAIEELNPSVSIGAVSTMDAVVESARAREAFVGVMLLFAAAASLFLGTVGIYGSVAHVVRQRTREIGIRIALGARRDEIVRMVTSGTVRATLAGSVLGLALAFPATRMLGSLLFGVEPHDPLTFAIVTTGLLVAAIGAALFAAWSAARIAPLLALRND